MRILFATHHASRVAGTETYVSLAMAALTARGHEVALLAEHAPVHDREPIDAAEARWCVETLGDGAALAESRRWGPDVAYVHGLGSERLELGVLGLAPAVLFAHAYAGLCISGSRTWQSSDTSCPRPLGPGCLPHYFPHRCGGRSPVTLVRDYARQRRTGRRHQQYRTIVTASSYVAGLFAASATGCRVRVLPLPVPPPATAEPRTIQTPAGVVFAGRLERLKGVHLLVGAVGHAAARLARPLQLDILGDGPLRGTLHHRTRRLAQPNLRVIVHGWQMPGERDAMFARSDVLVMPSLWPEPYGLSGLEAARFGVPTAAFASGGIPEWLHDGVNGTLATERSEAGLAGAIVGVLADAGRYRTLSAGALRAAATASTEAHAERLERLFEEAAG